MIDIFEHIYNFIVSLYDFIRLGAVGLAQIPHYLAYLTSFLTSFVVNLPPFFSFAILTCFNVTLLKFITNRGGDD